MPAIALTNEGLLNAKRAVADRFEAYKSSHLTEAIASACGFSTHAAALEKVRSQPEQDPDFVLLDDEAFARRLTGLAGEAFPRDYDGDWLDDLVWQRADLVIQTGSSSRFLRYPFKSKRDKVWRNMMVAAVNAGIAQRHFTAKPGDNRWPEDESGWHKGVVFDFDLNGIPAIGYASDAGFGELNIHCALWPTSKGRDFIRAGNCSMDTTGEAIATGWLERTNGTWLMCDQRRGGIRIACRRARLDQVAALDVRPTCFADQGQFIM